MPLACVKDLQIHCPAENALSDLQISSVLPALKTRLSNSFMDGGLANTYNTEDLLALLVYGLFVVIDTSERPVSLPSETELLPSQPAEEHTTQGGFPVPV
jgi:hypothetical protein